jgi:hypothetical protein
MVFNVIYRLSDLGIRLTASFTNSKPFEAALAVQKWSRRLPKRFILSSASRSSDGRSGETSRLNDPDAL